MIKQRFFQPAKPSTTADDQQLVNEIVADRRHARLNQHQASTALEKPGQSVIRIGGHNRKSRLHRRDASERASLMQTKRFKVSYMDNDGSVKHLDAAIQNGKLVAGDFQASSVDELKQRITEHCVPAQQTEVQASEPQQSEKQQPSMK